MELFFRPDLYHILSALYDPDRLLNTMKALRNLERPRRYSAFNASTAWCEEVLKKAGFSDVRRVTHQADGATVSYDFVMPQAWDLLGRSTLDMVEPVNERLADTDISTLHVAEYSAPTPVGGVTAEVVDYASLDPDRPDCAGKYVFYRGYLPAQHPLYHQLAVAGCVGVIYAVFAAIEHQPDSPSWTNGHGHIGWYHLKDDAVIPTYCISPKQGVKLAERLANGRVVLHGEVNAKLYDGEIYTVTATIPGKSAEEFALLGHLYEPFHTDDCQGFAVGVEVGLLLKQLIDNGTLPKPEKTLRLIFSMERYGFAAFFAQHDKKILAAMSIDSFTCLAGDILKKPFEVVESPLSLPFFGDMLAYEALTAFCPDLHWTLVPGSLSDDCWAAEPTVNIPTNWCVTGSCDATHDYHHCDAPIFDAVQPQKLARLVPMLAAYTAVMVCGDRNHFAAMAARLEQTAATWLEAKKNVIVGRLATGQLGRQDALWQKQAAEQLYLGRMVSFNRFYDGIVVPSLPEHWADAFFHTANVRCLSAAEQIAHAVRYRITATGMPFSQARVPSSERVSWPNISELTWALLSPERTVLDAIRLRDAVHGTHATDEDIRYFLSYCEFLETYGYVERV